MYGPVENPRVGGSIPSPATTFPCKCLHLVAYPIALGSSQLSGFAGNITLELHCQVFVKPASRQVRREPAQLPC